MNKPSFENFYRDRNFILALSFAVSFSILTLLVVYSVAESIDVLTQEFLVGYADNLPENVSTIFTYTNIPIYLTFIIGILFLIKEKYYDEFLTYISMVTVSFFTYQSLKMLISRVRPGLFIFYRSGFSYPSGHATMAFSVFIGLYVMYFIYGKMERNLLYLLVLSAPAVIITYFRVFIGFHYMTDIIGGYLLAATIVVLIPTLYRHPLIGKKIETLGYLLEKHIFSRFRL